MPARLNGEKARCTSGDADNVSTVSDHDVSGRAQATTDRLHRLVTQFGIEMILGKHCTRDTDQDSADLDAAQHAAGGGVDGDA